MNHKKDTKYPLKVKLFKVCFTWFQVQLILCQKAQSTQWAIDPGYEVFPLLVQKFCSALAMIRCWVL